MDFKKYILDKKYLILFYIILMLFISLVVYLDITVKVSIGNILYINFVSFVLFLIYLIGEYLLYKRYYEDINYIIKNQREDIINSLPNPNTYIHSLYNELLVSIYNQQNKKIEKLYEEKRENLEFITSWVHEIKTPIAVSRLIIENSMTKSKEEILDSLEEEIDKIEKYVEQALYYSRIDDFSKDYLISEIDIERVVKEVIKKHAKTFINKKIKIDIKNINMNVNTDKKWLMFIINQIIDNSLKYTDKGGCIKIYVEKDEREKRLIIEDNGIGIRKEDIQRVFDRGFTGYNGREYYKSTGMGLYLSKRLAMKLGHDITIESKFKEYTKVIIHFPKLIDYFNVAKL
ncbi:histidine kinase [Caloranaerobacter azorensis H53214]|uniref:histidine kinase n=1 Tax=Caloranaerobacter azorensis H53214 TaxID=1156417 RepID=A0A096CVE1_9FIRM|nr:sensor histidine kinase [Caloranaerobacter azorensis]KGG80499.1 histidine kinase [Caloranaerobacter azorensis H53214]